MPGALTVVEEGTEAGAERPAGAVTGAVTGSEDARGPAAGAACTTSHQSQRITAAVGVFTPARALKTQLEECTARTILRTNHTGGACRARCHAVQW